MPPYPLETVLTGELNFVPDPEPGALVGLPHGAVADAARVVGHAHVRGRVVLHFDRGGDGLEKYKFL